MLLTFAEAAPGVMKWATTERSYARGSEIQHMRVGAEFDALIYFARVTPANFTLR